MNINYFFVFLFIVGCGDNKKIPPDTCVDKIEYIYHNMLGPHSDGYVKENIIYISSGDDVFFVKEILKNIFTLKKDNELFNRIPDDSYFEFNVTQGNNTYTFTTSSLYIIHEKLDANRDSLNTQTACLLLDFYTKKTKKNWKEYFLEKENNTN